MPIVSPLAARVPVTEHVKDASAPHVPENSWIRGLAGAEDRLIVGFVDCATKLYQTSFLLATPQSRDGIVVKVAPTNVPAVLTQDVPDVNEIAPEQLSLAGGTCVTQILKSATDPAPEGLVPRFATRT